MDTNNYSEHYSNILSTLDYNKKHREEIYWVIYQLLNVIYKYYNQTQKEDINNCIGNKSKYNDGEKAKKVDDIIENMSDSESISMVLTQSKSKYAELKPPQRKKNKKSPLKSISKSGKSFSAISNISSSDDDSQR